MTKAGESLPKLWTDSRFKAIDIPDHLPAATIIRLADDRLLFVDGNATRSSGDNGTTWSDPHPIYRGESGQAPREGIGIPNARGQMLRTREDTLIVVYRDPKVLNWNAQTGEPGSDGTGAVWGIRSRDSGKTWGDRQRIFDGICGHPPINMIQTVSGRVVVPIQPMLPHPGRNVVRTYVSDDEGASWLPGNIIDLGGHGNHDGAFEPSIIELKDGRVWMLIRTNLDYLWEAISEDGGRFFHVIRPTAVEASSSPPFLARLASGRIALAWNRLYREGTRTYPSRDSGPLHMADDVSWQREELSLAFSDDEGHSWSKPELVARQKDARLAYPYLFEVEPGRIWLFTGQGKLQLEFLERDLIG